VRSGCLSSAAPGAKKGMGDVEAVKWASDDVVYSYVCTIHYSTIIVQPPPQSAPPIPP
jgi:hypothetical protein